MSEPTRPNPLTEAVRELTRAGFDLTHERGGLTVTVGETRWRVWRSRHADGAPAAFYATRPPHPWQAPRTLVADTVADLRQALKTIDGRL